MSVPGRARPPDTPWHPHPGIRVIAIGIVRDGDRLLCVEGWDPAEPEPFYRPIGGGVQVGERGSDALTREFREELGAEIASADFLGTSGLPFATRWIDVEGARRGQVILYPDGLLDLLDGGGR